MDSIAERDAAYQDIMADGMAVTFQRSVKGTHNSGTGVLTNTPTSYPTYGIVTDYKLRDIDGTLIKQGDRLLIMAATNGMPEPNGDDNVVINGVTWTVKNCNPVAPAGVPILYKIQVRR